MLRALCVPCLWQHPMLSAGYDDGEHLANVDGSTGTIQARPVILREQDHQGNQEHPPVI